MCSNDVESSDLANQIPGLQCEDEVCSSWVLHDSQIERVCFAFSFTLFQSDPQLLCEYGSTVQGYHEIVPSQNEYHL